MRKEMKFTSLIIPREPNYVVCKQSCCLLTRKINRTHFAQMVTQHVLHILLTWNHQSSHLYRLYVFMPHSKNGANHSAAGIQGPVMWVSGLQNPSVTGDFLFHSSTKDMSNFLRAHSPSEIPRNYFITLGHIWDICKHLADIKVSRRAVKLSHVRTMRGQAGIAAHVDAALREHEHMTVVSVKMKEAHVWLMLQRASHAWAAWSWKLYANFLLL